MPCTEAKEQAAFREIHGQPHQMHLCTKRNEGKTESIGIVKWEVSVRCKGGCFKVLVAAPGGSRPTMNEVEGNGDSE